MNILLVHNYYKIPGGEDTVVANEKRLLEDYGNTVILYKRCNDELDRYNGLKKLILPFKIIFSIEAYKEIRTIIKKEHIDIVHVHNTICMISPSVYYAAFAEKIPVVHTVHNFRLLCPGATFQRDGKICEECIHKGIFHACKYNCYKGSKLNTFAIAMMTSIHKMVGTYKRINYICLTNFNKKKLLEINHGNNCYIDPNKVFVKPNFASNNAIVIPWNLRDKQMVYVGRIDKTKGIFLLLEAWKKIKNKKLIICGTGPEEEHCKNYIEKNHLNNVIMKGFISNKEAKELIAHSQALILPTQWYEGFPMVLVESFSCGTPVLGSNIGNVNNIIIEGKNGMHFDYRSSDSIVNAVNSIKDICIETKKIYDRLYSPEINYKMLIKIYHKCLGDD